MIENFLSDERIFQLTEKYGTPLYVYDENILRQRCREMKNLITDFNFEASCSIKANSNVEIVKIVKEEGIHADAFSQGEIFILKHCGFKGSEIFYVSNNASVEDFKYARDNDVLIGFDSVSQIEKYGKIYPNTEISIRLNPGKGFGHSEKVITAGKKTNFGISQEFFEDALNVIKKYNLKLVGINQHLGSLFLDYREYIDGAIKILDIAKQFPNLKFVDLGGGFGVPYKHSEQRLDLKSLSVELTKVIKDFVSEYDNKEILFRTEPGRYIMADCGILLGTVNGIKENYGTKYIGTDLGLNVLIRPSMYGSHHEVHLAKRNKTDKTETITVMGNICESGDIIAKDRVLPVADEDDIVAVLTAGAYGYVMSSNYNSRFRPAEVMIKSDGEDALIRRRENFEDLISKFGGEL